MLGASPAAAASRAIRPSAFPEAIASQCPRSPHAHIGPAGSIWKWPISAAKPLAPRSTRPSTMTPPPMPVPSVTTSASRRPRATPTLISPYAATFASLSTIVGSPVASASAACTGTRRKPGTFGA